MKQVICAKCNKQMEYKDGKYFCDCSALKAGCHYCLTKSVIYFLDTDFNPPMQIRAQFCPSCGEKL